jgi:hypothetical protein
MRLKDLKGIARNLAAMACSETRLGYDFEHLAELPDGEVTLDLIRGSAIHSIAGAITLSVAQQLTSWLASTGAQNISVARVVLCIDTSTPPTERETLISFNLKGVALLEAQGRQYVGEASNHAYHNRPAQQGAPVNRPASRAVG